MRSRHGADVQPARRRLYRIVTDHLGTPRLAMNVSTGAIGERLDVDE